MTSRNVNGQIDLVMHVFNRVKTIAVIAIILTNFALLAPAYSQADRRFDGTWVGTETATQQQVTWDPKAPKPPSASYKTTIVVTQAGKLVNKTGGACSGQWEHVWWANNAINFATHTCKIKLTLSPNGKTLNESGSIALSPGHWGRSDVPAGYGNFELFGTFHRR